MCMIVSSGSLKAGISVPGTPLSIAVKIYLSDALRMRGLTSAGPWPPNPFGPWQALHASRNRVRPASIACCDGPAAKATAEMQRKNINIASTRAVKAAGSPARRFQILNQQLPAIHRNPIHAPHAFGRPGIGQRHSKRRILNPRNMSSKSLAKTLALLSLVLLPCRTTSAQILYGGLVGNVTDRSEAAVAGREGDDQSHRDRNDAGNEDKRIGHVSFSDYCARNVLRESAGGRLPRIPPIGCRSNRQQPDPNRHTPRDRRRNRAGDSGGRRPGASDRPRRGQARSWIAPAWRTCRFRSAAIIRCCSERYPDSHRRRTPTPCPPIRPAQSDIQ